MQKFYSLSKLVAAVVAAYDNGTPFNPAGCSGCGSIFTYQETDKQYQGKNVSIGNKLHAVSASALVNGINKALDQGMNVVPATARCMGYQRYVSIRGKRDVTSKAEQIATNQGDSPIQEDNIQEDVTDVVQPQDEESIVVSSNECESVQEIPIEAEESTPNWDYAFSLKKEETPKIKLKDYALKFGVELDLRKSFDAMMVHFQAGV